MERVGRVRNRSPKRSRSPTNKDRSRSRGRDRSKDRPANARLADKRVYISNIPYDVTWQNLKDLFRKEGNYIFPFSLLPCRGYLLHFFR